LYIGYRHGKNFCEIELQKQGIKIDLDIPHKELADPKGFARDVTGIGYWGIGYIEIKWENENDFEYVCKLIEQAFIWTL